MHLSLCVCPKGTEAGPSSLFEDSHLCGGEIKSVCVCVHMSLGVCEQLWFKR